MADTQAHTDLISHPPWHLSFHVRRSCLRKFWFSVVFGCGLLESFSIQCLPLLYRHGILVVSRELCVTSLNLWKVLPLALGAE